MKQLLISTTLIIINLLNIQAQGIITGKITDSKNQPLYGSNIYIQETKQGIMCNENGEYQTHLPKGNYTFEFRCLGYKSVTKKVTLATQPVVVNIALDEVSFILKEVTVTNKEDPAYAIIRKAISQAPFYLNAAKGYTAEAYIKANMELEKISALVNKLSSDKGMKMSDFQNQVFVQESYNEIKYIAPDKYTQTIKAFSSTIPENYDSKETFGIMSASIYSPLYNGCISPLNPKSFSYYKFKYEGFIEENGVTINKIKVESKLNDPQLLNGYIYIADNTWHVTYTNIEMNMMGGSQQFEVAYKEVGSNIYLPITYSNFIKINILGIKGYLNYYSSLKYSDILPNNDINETSLKNKKSKKRNFELKTDPLYVRISDTLATKRNQNYWDKIRSVPLDSLELISYQRKDSIKQFVDSIREKNRKDNYSSDNLLFGGQIGRDSSLITIDYKGLIYALHDYNFVDGFSLGQAFTINYKPDRKHTAFTISPYIYYTTARKQLIYGSKLNISYMPKQRGNFKLEGGSDSKDFNPNGITRLDNILSSIFTRSNKSFFYRNDFIAVNNNIDIANGLKLSTGIEIAKRTGLSNNTDWAIWGSKDKIHENPFSGKRFDKTSYSIGLSYAPYAYYSIHNQKKIYRKVTSPVFSINYTEGFSGWQTNNSRFRKLNGSIVQDIKLSYFSNLDYTLNGGGFLGNTQKVHYTDFEHFNTSDVMISGKTPYQSYMLLDNYKYSTNRYWIGGHINYRSKYILLKRLPFLQGIPVSEALHVKALYTPGLKLYNEAGYSINILGVIGIGGFASFSKGKYESCGFRLTYNLQEIAAFK